MRCCSHHWPPHILWQESSNSYVAHTGFHGHYNSTVLRQVTRDTKKLYGYKSTMHPEKTLLYMKTKRHYFPTDSHVQQNFQLPPCSPLPACFHQ